MNVSVSGYSRGKVFDVIGSVKFDKFCYTNDLD